MKKILIVLSLLLSAVTVNTYAANYSDWAEENIQEAILGGILTKEEQSKDLTAPITREEIARLATKAYINVTGEDYLPKNPHFTDTQSPYAAAVFDLGIMYGTSDTEFTPYNNTTRQEMAKIILSLKSVLDGEELILPQNPRTEFIDFDEVSDWAKPYVAKASSDEIIMGYPDGSFKGDAEVSWEQAIALVVRCADLNERDEIETYETVPEREINLSGSVGSYVESGDVRLKWNSPSGNTKASITQERNSYYEGDIDPITDFYNSAGFIDITLNPNRKYTVSVTDGPQKSFYTPEISPEGGDAILAGYPTTKEEADALMVSVTVPVWRLSGDKKVASTATFSIHKDIAEKVKLVFDDIFNGPEQFPIRDVGGYAWRGGRSEHNGGTAIDINYNENYCIYNNGTVIGQYWKPYEDPYSITPYGDVVNAFERHGFTWGGDAWRNPKDYMHFSYLGT